MGLYIILEGDSSQVIGCLQLSRELTLSISSAVSASVAVLGSSFKHAIPVWVQREANIFAHNVSQWAAGRSVLVGPSWMSVPRSLFSLFG